VSAKQRQLLQYLLLLLAVAIGGTDALAQSGGSGPYNGIVPPTVWPPIQSPTQADPIPTYITNPPAVIPIDVGRQLFVDDFLIQQTTMTRTQHQPVIYPLNPIVAPGQEDTAGFAMPFSDGVWFDPSDQLFKMWLYCGPGNTTCYAYSPDGEHWVRPSLPNAAVPNTDQVLVAPPGTPGITGLTVWMDLQETNPARRFKAFASDGVPPAFLFFSPDGIQWSATNQTLYLIPMFDRTTYFWNPFRNVWVDSLKTYTQLAAGTTRPSYPSRARDYTESVNLATWTPASPQDATNYWTGPNVDDPPYAPGGSYPQLYNLDAVAYESVMVGLFNWFYPGPGDTDQGNLPGPDLVELGVGFSRDGFQWVRPTRGSGPGPGGAFIPASDVAGTWNMGNVQSAGGGFLIVGDELWFYFSGQSALHDDPTARGSTGLATLRRDGFYSMDAGPSPAVLTTRPVTFSGRYLFVNVTDPKGALQVQVLNPNTGAVLATSMPVSVDKTLQAITWQNGLADLSGFANEAVEFQFTLTNGELYSFWVSASTSGASNGYVAANGPGFSGPVDNLGIAAYPTSAATPEIYPAGGVVSPFSPITIVGRTLGSSIYYTTDGSTPTTSSTLYMGPINLTASGTVQAIASAPGLNSSAVASASFNVDTTPPTVSITAPTSGQIVSAGISLSATAIDNTGIASVQFLVDGVVVGTVSSAPYTLTFETTTVTNGSHQITALATDVVGNPATSAPVTVVVDNVSSGPTAGLVGYWSFDPAYVNGSTIYDQSGYSGDATALSTNFVTGQIGQAAQFNGSSSYVQIASSLSTDRYDLMGDLSLSLWVETKSSGAPQALISRYSSGGSGSGYLLRTNASGTVELLLGIENLAGGNNTLVTDVTKINDGNWHHVALVIRLGTSVSFYIDGALSSSQAIDTAAAPAPSLFQFGLNPWTPYGTYFNGTMDEVRIYNRALSANDVASLYLSVAVTPVVATLSPGMTEQFAATVQNATNQSVTWSVSPQVGTISSSGLYTPPSPFTISQAVTVTATTVAAPHGAGSATVNLVAPILVSVSPTSVTLYQGQTQPFTATVQNTSNTSVTWSINPNVGSVSSAGVYTAPATISSAQTVTVTATSVVDTTKSSLATISLSPPISVSVGPTSMMLYQGQTQSFTAAVQNTSNTSVTWSINPNVGSVSSAGVYAAPATISSAQTVTVSATSVVDATKSSSATVTLSPPISVSVSPASMTLYQGQTQPFTSTVQNASNTSVTWSINPSVGSVSSSGLYTAPATINSVQTVTVTATSIADPTKSGSASVSLTVTSNTPTDFVTSKTLGAIRNDYTGFVGMNITVGASPITVTALGRIVLAGNTGSHVVKIVQASNGADVTGGSVTVNTAAGEPGSFAYASLSSPITLNANTSYYVVTQETQGGDQWYDYNNTIVQTTNVATVGTAIYGSGSSYFTEGSTGQTYGPVDFLYGGTTSSAPSISQQPQSSAVTAGQVGTFSVVASGATGYQWQEQVPGGTSFTNISGAVGTSYTTGTTQLSDNGTEFRCTVSNNTGSVTSSAATLTVSAAASGTPYVTSEVLGALRNNYSGFVGMTITVGASPITVTALGRMVVAGNTGSHVVKIVQEANGVDVAGGSVTVNTGIGTPGSFVYAPLSSPITLNANTSYYVVTQETLGGDQWYDYNNSILQTTNVASINSAVYGTGAPYVTIGSTGQSYGPANFMYTVASGSGPSISQQPQSSAVTAGQVGTFSVVASGATGYQWQEQVPGGTSFTNISGAVGTSYTTGTTQLSDNGTEFRCTVSNNTGSVTSSAATLTVSAAASGTPYVTSEVLGALRNNYSGFVGMTITVGASPITVTALGRMVVAGNTGSHVVKIVQEANGVDVAGGSVTVNTGIGTPGSFVYAPLSSPITLNANTSYYVVTQEMMGGDQWYDYNNSILQTTNVASINSAVYNSGSSYITPGSMGQTYGPVNFLY
jgi:Concanavalin A-like lectin/glucanases superfamily/Bacterial Ig domain/Chitobiase/beta-hexosaminidase C-terminal domain/Bacterial Ig-like domain (group 2)